MSAVLPAEATAAPRPPPPSRSAETYHHRVGRVPAPSGSGPGGVGDLGDEEWAMVHQLPKRRYEQELVKLQGELATMTEWIHRSGSRVVVVFEGRDAAGKGGVIKRISEYLSPRVCRIVALPAPTERERGEWYFQRYVAELPSAGEMALFDRSWYNRAGVERVMGFCTDEQYQRFLRQCPVFEHQLIEDGIILIKYWFSVSDDEQERRFQSRVDDPLRRWKLSPMDLEARQRWVDYSRAKDNMFLHTDTPESPWYVVEADDKRGARLNCIAHLLEPSALPTAREAKLRLPKRVRDESYQRPPRELATYVPDVRVHAGRPGLRPNRRRPPASQPGMRRQTARGRWRMTVKTQRRIGRA